MDAGFEGGLIVNRVAASALVTLDLAAVADPLPEASTPVEGAAYVALDLAPMLEAGGRVLREQPFRAAVAALDVAPFAGCAVQITCSTPAIVPPWAYQLVAARLAPVAARVAAGPPDDRWAAALAAHDWSAYAGRPVVVKGCGAGRVPLDAFVRATGHLIAAGAAKILYGEACSAVPVWRAPASTQSEAARPAAASRPAGPPPRAGT